MRTNSCCLFTSLVLLSTPVYADDPPPSEVVNTGNKIFHQIMKFDFKATPTYYAVTSTTAMDLNIKSCGNHCSDLVVTSHPNFSTGKLLITLVRSEKLNKIQVECRVKLNFLFDVQYNYLVTPMTIYPLNWVSMNAQPCPKNPLSLQIDGDPTEPTGYTVTLIDSNADKNKKIDRY